MQDQEALGSPTTLQEFIDEVYAALVVGGRPIYTSDDDKFVSLAMKAVHEWCDQTYALKSDRIEFTPTDGNSAFPLSNAAVFEMPVQTVRTVEINECRLSQMSYEEYRQTFSRATVNEDAAIPTKFWVEGDILYFNVPVKLADFDSGWISGTYYPYPEMDLGASLPIPFSKILSCETYVIGRLMMLGCPTQDQREAAAAMMKTGIESAAIVRAKGVRQVASTQKRLPSRGRGVRLGD